MYDRIPAVSEIPRITTEEFCAEIDTIFEKITKENAAFILQSETEDYLICPADWVRFEQRRVPAFFPNYSVKHALSKNADMTDIVCAAVRDSLHMLSYGSVEKMILDISAFIRKHPDNAGVPKWAALLEDLKAELPKIDTVEVPLQLDVDMLAELEKLNRKRDLTFQQWAELTFEQIVRSRGLLPTEAPKEES